jgi:hypothetical protein
VGAGGQFEGQQRAGVTGAATWVAITNVMGGPIAGVSTVLADGTIDGRVSADDTTCVRPATTVQDIEIQTLASGTQLQFQHDRSDIDNSGGSGTSRTYTLNLSTVEVKLFASPESTTGNRNWWAARFETPTISRSTTRHDVSSKTVMAASTTISGLPST